MKLIAMQKLIATMNDFTQTHKPLHWKPAKPVLVPLICLSAFVFAAPALAHHPFGGMTPDSWVEGLLSGLGHPVIGPDHLLFTIVVGLLATQIKPAWAIPAAFLTAALAGTGLHLMAFDLPAPELMISLSVVIFGGLAAYRRSLHLGPVVLLTAMAGLFHGYAYGEAIVGAEITPLLFYLIGFTAVQGGIMAGAFGIVQWLIHPAKRLDWLRYAGLVVCGAGSAFISSIVLG